MILQLFCQTLVGRIVFADDENSCGILIDSVDDAGAQYPVDPRQLIPAVFHQPVDQSALIVARCRMNDHVLGFIDQNNVPVFIDNVQIHFFRLNGELRRLRNLQNDPFPFPDFIIALFFSVIYQHR